MALAVVPASAQELVPAAYTPAPYGVNLLSIATTFNSGDLSFDPSAPIEDGSADILSSSLTYARTMNIGGRSANIMVIMPYVLGDLEGLYLGEPASAHRSGIGDVAIRGAINLLGAPAMNPKEFAGFRPRWLIGASVMIKAPTGQYDSSRLINIGTNRWSFKPEVGVVYVTGSWAVDAYVGGWFFADNPDFFGGVERMQEPMVSTQAHVRYRFSPKVWAAVDGNFWVGGQSTVGGTVLDDKQQNSRVGLTVVTRVGRHHSVRVAISRGAYTRIGGDFDSIGVSYSYSWAKKR
jgi:hypothetical protein